MNLPNLVTIGRSSTSQWSWLLGAPLNRAAFRLFFNLQSRLVLALMPPAIGCDDSFKNSNTKIDNIQIYYTVYELG